MRESIALFLATARTEPVEVKWSRLSLLNSLSIKEKRDVVLRFVKEREKNNFPDSVRDLVLDQGRKSEPGEPGEGFLTQR